MKTTDIQSGYTPGIVGRIVGMHATYYSTRWGFGSFFEAKVARELADFIDRYDAGRDGLWAASAGGAIQGAIVIDGLDAEHTGAHLRWFIVSDAYRGKGIGGRLLDLAVDFCRRAGYRSVYLWTFEGLYAARHLYEKAGFVLDTQHPGRQWGTPVNEQRYVMPITDRS